MPGRHRAGRSGIGSRTRGVVDVLGMEVTIHTRTRTGLSRDLGFGVLAIIAVAAASCSASLPSFRTWLAGTLGWKAIVQPNWIFGPVWTTLYLLSALAIWRILRLPETSAARRSALTLFFTQLALNAAWSWMFFGAHNPLLGVVNIIAQFLIILATIAAFYRLDRLAAWCLVPLAAWVAFASILNIAIWQLND